MMAGHSTPHFLFDLAEKKTGRGRSKRKERLAPNLHVRASWLSTGVFRIGATKVKNSPTGARCTLAIERPSARVYNCGGNFGELPDTLSSSFR